MYMQCLYVYNKIDQISLEEVDRLAKQPHSVVIRNENDYPNLLYVCSNIEFDPARIIAIYPAHITSL